MKKCNCFSESLLKIKEKYNIWPPNGKKVKSFDYSDGGLNFVTGKFEVGIGIDIEFEDQKKKGHTYLNMIYCPLCGNKLED